MPTELAYRKDYNWNGVLHTEMPKLDTLEIKALLGATSDKPLSHTDEERDGPKVNKWEGPCWFYNEGKYQAEVELFMKSFFLFVMDSFL